MTDVGQTGVSGEQSRRFATVNDDEFNRILTEKDAKNIRKATVGSSNFSRVS
jgi:hypothetical protein